MTRTSDHDMNVFWSVFEARHGLLQPELSRTPKPPVHAADGTPEQSLPSNPPESE